MRKVACAIILASISIASAQAPPAPATPTLTLPATKTVKPNRYFCLKPETNCKTLKWIVPPGLDPIDPEIPLKDALAVVLIGDTGTYVVQCYGALGDQATDIASCTVTVGTPTPPAPPTPPTPTNPLTASLQAAYNLDTDTDKAESLAFLQAVYAGMAKSAGAWTTVKTNGDALKAIQSIVQSPAGLATTQVVNLRKAIAADFTARFGTTPTTTIDLAALATELQSVSTALSGVK